MAETASPALSRKERTEVKLGGFGGQGIILAGMILGRAATVYAQRNAVMSQSFGPESRGGACMAEIVIADGEIAYPRPIAPDIVVMMSQEAYGTYATSRPAHSLLIVDEDLVQLDENLERGKQVLKAPATRLAERLGRRMVANIAMLGFLCGATNVVSPAATREAVLTSVPKGTEELNLKAFDAGHEHARRILSEKKGDQA
jgi:2-oxoglutarate ferredoxin oxidoreductase subunit gamma